MALRQPLEVGTIGVLAHRALDHVGQATVIARFERSFCLDIAGKLITIGDESLDDGPLNLRLADRFQQGVATAIDVITGESWTLSPRHLRRADGLEIDHSRAEIWQPESLHGVADRSLLSVNLAFLRHCLVVQERSDDGLIQLVLDAGPLRTATERAAQPCIRALVSDLPNWLARNDVDDAAAALQLLGLGPGLTPSGDDLLAGLLITWYHLGASSTAERLGRALLTSGAERTNRISLTHLEAAAEGFGAAPMHDLLLALGGDDRRAIIEALDAASKIGHSSGLDAIAGLVLALTAWLEAGREAPVAA